METSNDCGLTGLTFEDPSLTRQEFADECDLRLIIKRFLKTGQLPDSRMSSDIVDATRLPSDFQELQDSAVRIREGFDRLPLEVRNRYNNDPLAWLDTLEHEERRKESEVVKDETLQDKSKDNEPPKEDSQGSSSEPQS